MFAKRKLFRLSACLSVLITVGAAISYADAIADRLMSPASDVRAQAQKDLDASDKDQKKVIMIGLIEGLRKDPESARWAAEALAHFGPDAKEAVPDLVEAMRYDDATTYTTISTTLLKIGQPSLPFLQSALDDANFFVRQRAAETLGLFGPDAKKTSPALIRLLHDSQYQVHDAAEAALLRIGDSALPALAEDLRIENQDMARSILTTLGKFGPSADPILLQTLKKDEDASVRAAAAEVLGNTRPASNETVMQMAADLKDLDEWVRVAIAEALGNLETDAKAAIGDLILHSHNDRDPLVRDKSTASLKKIGPPTEVSLPAMSRAFKDDNVDVRKDVVNALIGVSLPIKAVSPLLGQAARDSDPDIRQKVSDLIKNLTPPAVSTPTATSKP